MKLHNPKLLDNKFDKFNNMANHGETFRRKIKNRSNLYTMKKKASTKKLGGAPPHIDELVKQLDDSRDETARRMSMPAPGILQSDLEEEQAAAEEAAKQAQYDYMLNSGDHFLPQHLGLSPKAPSQAEDLQDDGSGIGGPKQPGAEDLQDDGSGIGGPKQPRAEDLQDDGSGISVPKEPGAQDPNIPVHPVAPPNTPQPKPPAPSVPQPKPPTPSAPQPKPPTLSTGTDASAHPSSAAAHSQTDADSGDTLYVSQGDKERLVKANKKTIKDLQDALRDATDSLHKAEALKVADKSKSGSMSNMFNGPPAGTNIKQHTIGLILPANTEFYNLPPSGINANTYFANLFGQTIQSPLSIVAGPAQNPPLQSVQTES